jgi:hypothetical protein
VQSIENKGASFVACCKVFKQEDLGGDPFLKMNARLVDGRACVPASIIRGLSSGLMFWLRAIAFRWVGDTTLLFAVDSKPGGYRGS